MDDEQVTLRVYGNPYSYLDHKGRAVGVCPCDPVGHTSMTDRRWVGASLDHANCSGTHRPPGDIRAPVTKVTFLHHEDEQVVPMTHYYLDRIREGSLIAADADTAALAGMTFLDPETAFDAHRDAARALFVAHYGKEPAFIALEAAREQARIDAAADEAHSLAAPKAPAKVPAATQAPPAPAPLPSAAPAPSPSPAPAQAPKAGNQ